MWIESGILLASAGAFGANVFIFCESNRRAKAAGRSRDWWNASALLLTSLSQLLWWALTLSLIFGWVHFGYDDPAEIWAIAIGVFWSISGLIAAVFGSGWARLTNGAVALTSGLLWLLMLAASEAV